MKRPFHICLLTKIEEIHGQSRGTYSSPSIHAVLRNQAIGCGCKRVARLDGSDQPTS